MTAGRWDNAQATIDVCPKTAVIAVQAIRNLWDLPARTFWRSTEQRTRYEDREETSEFFPTVTFRCAEALFELAYSHPTWLDQQATSLVVDTLDPIFQSFQIQKANSSTLSRDAGAVNPFTLALYVAAQTISMRRTGISNHQQQQIVEALKLILSDGFPASGEVDAMGRHPFVVFHVDRAYRSAASLLALPAEVTIGFTSLADRFSEDARQSIERAISQNRLRSLNAGDAVALSFQCAILANHGDVNQANHLLEGLEIVARFQDASGCWPLGRVTPENKDLDGGRLEIPTHEVGLAVSQTLQNLLRFSDEGLIASLCEEVAAPLAAAVGYVQESIVRLPGAKKGPPREGWCSDAPFAVSMIESWTSAIVLQLMVHYHRFADRYRSAQVLAGFRRERPHAPGWPDHCRWTDLCDQEEDDETPVLKYISEHLIEPIKNHPDGLPSAQDLTTSLLLFGPPGTSKTTIARGIADGLGWPVIFLSPGTFIEDGLETIEATAKEVFEQLGCLVNAVVLFDECDELFRNREPVRGLEQMRGITAFVTASMLPKLQDLHDTGRVLYVICTNHLGSLDSAIRRGGRVDHMLGIGPPSAKRRLAILASTEKYFPGRAFLQEFFQSLADLTDGFTRSELIRASLIAASRHSWKSSAGAKRVASRVAKEMQRGLTIKNTELKGFRKDQRDYCHAAKERRA